MITPFPAVASFPPDAVRPRVLFYSINGVGLGHLRQTLAIADELGRRRSDAAMLAITSSFQTHAFELPPNFDYIKLPSDVQLGMTRPGRTASRESAALWRLRRQLIGDIVEGYRPHLVFVDHEPIGLGQELLPALAALRRTKPAVKMMLGLIDIPGDARQIRANWAAQRIPRLLESIYDHILIYGMREIYDPVQEYDFPPAAAAKTVFCGYLRRREELVPPARIRAELGAAKAPLIVVVGGGSSGGELADAYFAALRGHLLGGLVSFVVSGPQAASDHVAGLAATAADLPGVTFVPFTADLPSYLNAADVVVTRGGYNGLCEVVSLGKRAIVVPRRRVIDREQGLFNEEQAMRAARFAERGLVTMLHPDDLNPERLARAVRDALAAPPPVATLDFGGLDRIGAILADALST